MYIKILKLLNTCVIMLLPIMTYFHHNKTPINIALSDLLLIFMGLVILTNIKILFTKKNKWIQIYFISLILSLVLSQIAGNLNTHFITAPNQVLLIEVLKTIIVAIYFIFAFIFTIKTKDYHGILLTISYSSIPVLMIGYTSFIQRFIGTKPTIKSFEMIGRRFLGTFEDPNLCAFYLCMIIFVSLYNFTIHKKRHTKITLLLILYLSAIACFLTMSRGGILALMVGIGLLLIVKIKIIKLRSFVYLLPFIIMLILGIYMDQTYFDKQLTNYTSTRLDQTLSMNLEDINRFQLSTAALKMGNDNPILGVGKGSFPLNSYKYLGLNNFYYKRHSLPHNTLASFYAQQGIIGLLIFLSLFVIIFKLTLNHRQPHHDYLYALSLCWLTQSLTINTENIRFFWYFFGLVLAYELTEKEQLDENPLK